MSVVAAFTEMPTSASWLVCAGTVAGAGSSFTGATVIVTVAVSQAPEGSQTSYSKVSMPLKFAAGV